MAAAGGGDGGGEEGRERSRAAVLRPRGGRGSAGGFLGVMSFSTLCFILVAHYRYTTGSALDTITFLFIFMIYAYATLSRQGTTHTPINFVLQTKSLALICSKADITRIMIYDNPTCLTSFYPLYYLAN